MDGTQQPKKKWGITHPLSEAKPEPKDLKANEQLIEYLKSINNFESPEGNDRRYVPNAVHAAQSLTFASGRVLNHLQKVTEEFVKRVGRTKGLPQSTIDNLGGKVFTYGSYTIGVHGPDSDIDTLVVAPKTIDMGDYFAHFGATFKEMSDPKLIDSFVEVPDAFVPIIKLEYDGVDIDLIFASLPSQSSIPRDFTLHDQSVLRGLDDQTIRSVNGVRTAKELLELVPQAQSFRHALRAIKVWANKRAVYGFVFGFPGGIAWALMVARVCQLYPFACGSTIIAKFFALMQQWNWPRPVMLKDLETSNILNLQIWNPLQNYQDKLHLMPVITPAYPSMCATHSVTHSTLAIMKKEFERANSIVTAIPSGTKSWADLFRRHTFFTQDHKYYLSVIVSSTGDKDKFDAFSGKAQSRVRILAKNIENGNAGGIAHLRAYMKGIDRVHSCASDAEVDEVRKGSTKYQVSPAQASESAGQKTTVYTSTWYIGLVTVEGETKLKLDISYPVEDYKRIIEEDPGTFDKECMATKIVHTRW
jgi:poly(A) polymerase